MTATENIQQTHIEAVNHSSVSTLRQDLLPRNFKALIFLRHTIQRQLQTLSDLGNILSALIQNV